MKNIATPADLTPFEYLMTVESYDEGNDTFQVRLTYFGSTEPQVFAFPAFLVAQLAGESDEPFEFVGSTYQLKM